MGTVQKLNIADQTGAFKNINDLLDELRNGNIEALAIAYTRKDDHSTRTFRNGFNRVLLIGTLEQLKFDILEGGDFEFTDYDKGLDN